MRIEALVRRSRRSRWDGEAAAPERPERFALGPFTFDEVRHEVLKGGESVVLTPKEFQLLHHLASIPAPSWAKTSSSRSYGARSTWTAPSPSPSTCGKFARR